MYIPFRDPHDASTFTTNARNLDIAVAMDILVGLERGDDEWDALEGLWDALDGR